MCSNARLGIQCLPLRYSLAYIASKNGQMLGLVTLELNLLTKEKFKTLLMHISRFLLVHKRLSYRVENERGFALNDKYEMIRWEV